MMYSKNSILKIKYYSSTFVIGLLLHSSILFAGTTGKIAGQLTNVESGEALVGANVIIASRWVSGELVEMDFPLGAAADLNGEYYILNLKPGYYDVEVSMLGYRGETRSKVRVDVDKTTGIDFALATEAVEGEEVVVTAFRQDKVEVGRTSTKQVYLMEDIEDMAGVTDIADIINLQADVVDDHVRGGRVGESLYLISGASIVNPLNNQRAYSPIAAGLQQVEVITSGFSAEYGNAQSGVINMIPREGGDEWTVYFDASSSLPHLRNWGGDYYSNDLMPHDILAGGVDTWMGPTPGDSSTAFFNQSTPNWTAFMPRFMTLEDSLKFADLAYRQYLGHARDLGRDVAQRTDSRVNVAIGGPISSTARMFISGGQNTKHLSLPTVWPNRDRQLMMNLTNRFGENDKVTLSANISDGFSNSIAIGRAVPYLFELEHNNVYKTSKVLETGVKWVHVFSAASLMDLNIRYFNTINEERINTRNPGVFLTKNNNSYITKYSGPGSITNNIFASRRGIEETKTYSVMASYNNQITQNNLVKVGLQHFMYDLVVDRESKIDDPSQAAFFDYHAKPFEGAVYVQDKLEFQGMVANLGLRMDYYDFNTEYYADKFSPLRNPNYDSDPSIPYKDREPYYDDELALKNSTDMFAKLQSRIGLAYPVSEWTVVHLNYGTFTQRPDMSKIFDNFIVRNFSSGTGTVTINRLGNPNLKPESTVAYDLGFMHSFQKIGATLELGAYYKDVKNLVQHVFYEDETGNLYETFENREYADIKGFHINLEKRAGSITALVSYNYQASTGKSATAFDADIKYIEKPDEGELAVELPDPGDVYLDYDRTHRLVSTLSYFTKPDAGPKIFGLRPLASLVFNVRYTYQTGRPYTYDTEGLGLLYNKRTPTFSDMKLRFQKSFSVGEGRYTLYAEAFNFLNERDYSYSMFDAADDYAKTRWEEVGEEAAMTYEDHYPLVYRQELAFLKNKPTNYRLGLTFRL